jgi:hypothetical protein
VSRDSLLAELRDLYRRRDHLSNEEGRHGLVSLRSSTRAREGRVRPATSYSQSCQVSRLVWARIRRCRQGI